jgi:hypothetical protein
MHPLAPAFVEREMMQIDGPDGHAAQAPQPGTHSVHRHYPKQGANQHTIRAMPKHTPHQHTSIHQQQLPKYQPRISSTSAADGRARRTMESGCPGSLAAASQKHACHGCVNRP